MDAKNGILPAAMDDRSCTMGTANLVCLAIAAPIGALAAVLGILGGGPTLDIAWWFIPVALVAGLVVHEFIHGLTWAWCGRRSLRDVEFGFLWRSLTPYARVKSPINVWAYRIGTAMPGLVLGVLPAVLGLIIGMPVMWVFGGIMTVVAGGDMLILWLIRDVPADRLVLDHPTRAGCQVFAANLEPNAAHQ